MTDFEITKLCAASCGSPCRIIFDTVHILHPLDGWIDYRPLHDDAQAMALVKKFRLDITNFFGADDDFHEWRVRGTIAGWEISGSKDLNRAICECVAKMQLAKQKVAA